MRFILAKNIPIIEDVGEALGSKYWGNFLQHWLDFSVFHFMPLDKLHLLKEEGISANQKNIDLIDKIRRFGINQKTFRDSRKLVQSLVLSRL